MRREDALERAYFNMPFVGRDEDAIAEDLIAQGLATARSRSDSGAARWIDLTDAGLSALKPKQEGASHG